MGLFKYIYRFVAPKILIERQKMLIFTLKALDSRFKIFVKSNEEVLLKSPKDTEGEEINILLNQKFSSSNYTQRNTLNIHYVSTVEEEPLDINFNFEDPTNYIIIINTVVDRVKKETDRIYNRHKQLQKAREEINATVQKELEYAQKAVLLKYLVKFTGNTNKNKYLKLLGLKPNDYEVKLASLLTSKKFLHETILTVRNKEAIYTYIYNCCNSVTFQQNDEYKQEFINILIEWGFTQKEIENFLNTIRISILDFKETHGDIIKTCRVVDNQTGELYFLYVFENFEKTYTYVASCPYFRKLSLKEIEENQTVLYIRYGKERCFYLCTKDSEINRLKYMDVIPEYNDANTDSDLEYLLTQLNVTPESDAFTVEFVDELNLQ